MPDPVIPSREGEGEAETFTRDDVTELLAERDRRWQSRLTPLQQERAELRRTAERVSYLEGKLEALEQNRGSNGSRREREDDLPEPDWADVDNSDKLKRAVQLEANRIVAARERAREREHPQGRGESGELAEEVHSLLLERDVRALRSEYRGMNDDQVRQVINLGIRTGNGDLSYLAFQLFGSPRDFTPGEFDDDSDDAGARTRRDASRFKPGLAGRAARAQAQAGTPKKVTVPRGDPGYRAVSAMAKDWLKERGHS